MTSTAMDEYLAGVPREARKALQKLRKDIRAAAPDAEEVISYSIPAFRQDGKLLVSFAAHPHHCGFYVMSPSVVEAHAADLAGYDLAKGTVRFAPDEPLPAALVQKLVKARIAENGRAAASRTRSRG